jgi:hypothetical protein
VTVGNSYQGHDFDFNNQDNPMLAQFISIRIVKRVLMIEGYRFLRQVSGSRVFHFKFVIKFAL